MGTRLRRFWCRRIAEPVFAGVASLGGRLLELRGVGVFGLARQALTAAVELRSGRRPVRLSRSSHLRRRSVTELISRRVGDYRSHPMYGLTPGQAWVR